MTSQQVMKEGKDHASGVLKQAKTDEGYIITGFCLFMLDRLEK